VTDQWQTNDHLKDIHPIANLTYEDEEKETTEKEKIIILFLKSERFSNTSFGHFIEFLAILSEHFRRIDIRRTRFIRFCKTKQKTTKSNKTFENSIDLQAKKRQITKSSRYFVQDSTVQHWFRSPKNND